MSRKSGCLLAALAVCLVGLLLDLVGLLQCLVGAPAPALSRGVPFVFHGTAWDESVMGRRPADDGRRPDPSPELRGATTRRCALPVDRCFDALITWRNNSGSPTADTELLFLLRSIERFGMDAHVRLVHIVVQGLTDESMPWYLDRSSPTLRIHKHIDIFRDKAHLPTDSRNAIMSNFDGIPELAPLFLYIEDDQLLASPFRIGSVVREVYADSPVLERRYGDGFLAQKDPLAVSHVPTEVGRRVPQLVQYTGGPVGTDALEACTDVPAAESCRNSMSCAGAVLRHTFGTMRLGAAGTARRWRR